MTTERCQHTKQIRAQVDLELARPSEPKSRYQAPISLFICEECGHIELFADLPQLLGVWLERR